MMQNKIILLSLCLGLINAGRGSGVANMKFPELFIMSFVGWIVTGSYYAAVIFPIPVAVMFATGTGWMMPYFAWTEWRRVELGMIWIYIKKEIKDKCFLNTK